VVEAVLQVLASGQRGALATVVRTSGSTPQGAGARLLLLPNGELIRTVGGGAIEHAVAEALRRTLRTGRTELMTRELGHDLGMCCGGRMELFLEPIEAAPRLTLFGAGHIAKPTAALARSVGFDVHVVDEREELATAERFPDCELSVLDGPSLLRRTPLGARDFVLIVTHDHQVDEEVLALVLREPTAYVGLVGSKRKVFRLVQRLQARHGELDLSRLYAPVGLDLGAASPEEIAVSIVAELVAIRHGRVVPHLRAVDDVRLQRTLAAPDPAAAEPSAPRPEATLGLPALAERVHQDLTLLSYPQREWLIPRRTAAGAPVFDVVIVGAGQGGLACAFGLMRERVKNLLVIDQNPLDRAGPWLNFARMRTLRTPKYLTGPDLGIPNLTPRSWYEAQHGEGSWDTLGLIPKEAWAAYLAWYRETLRIPVQSDTTVGALSWDESEQAYLVPCTSSRPGGQAIEPVVYARRVVLATGIEGSGQWQIPSLISENIPEHLYAHTRWDIDFAALRGKRIAVLGAGASAFDNAATALEHGASEVHMYFRRKSLVNVNAYRWAEFVGFLRHMGDLPDADKWRFIQQILRMGQLPPADTYQRAREFPGFQLRPGSAWKSVTTRGETIAIETAQGTSEYDFVIVGTGFVTDLRLRPELANLEQHIARWSDRYTPLAGDESDELARHPYLGPAFEFSEREPGEAPYLRNLYNYTFGCLLSLGFGGASISGMKYSVPRLVSGITRSLFVEDRARYFESLSQFAEREF
jgi:FAD-dependent urate hydroxylase